MISYKAGYKYQLAEDYQCTISIRPKHTVAFCFITLGADGVLTIKQGYAWDGPSGPTFDSINFMRGSLVHDALYQLMRHGLLGNHLRDAADRILQRMCIEDGMSRIRAWWVYSALKHFGGDATNEANIKTILFAP